MLILRAVNTAEEKFILCRFHFCLCLLSFPAPEENEKEFFPLAILVNLELPYLVGLNYIEI